MIDNLLLIHEKKSKLWSNSKIIFLLLLREHLEMRIMKIKKNLHGLCYYYIYIIPIFLRNALCNLQQSYYNDILFLKQH